MLTLFLGACSGNGETSEGAVSDKEQVSASPRQEEVREQAEGGKAAPTVRQLRNGRLHINSLGAPLARIFNDSNASQLVHARRLGIEPIKDNMSAFNTRRPICEIVSNEHYQVDDLTHSLPFLVPEAALLLDEIGEAFNDSLAARGGRGYRIKVTSLLRTAATVRALRRINANATDSSTHQYGTTFDISYAKFQEIDTTQRLRQEDLKNLLAEVLYEFRRQGRCMIKYERKSPCFHITAIR